MNKTNPFLLVTLLMVLLSACGSSPTPQPSASSTPRVDVTTLRAALATTSGASELTTDQPAATLSPVFDLNRTQDNPITDAQQIVEILEGLERIERSQSIPPGWYLGGGIDLINSENPINYSSLYHVIDGDLNCDLAMHFMLSPNGDILGLMTRNYGTPIHSLPGGEITLMEGATVYSCNLSNPNLTFFNDYSNTFSNKAHNWPEQEGIVDFSYSAWFENELDQLVFVLQEKTNVHSGYQTDPDIQEMVAIRSEEKLITYSVDTGFLVWFQSTAILANNKTVVQASSTQRGYYAEKSDLPPSVLTYLEDSLLKYDELQLP